MGKRVLSSCVECRRRKIKCDRLKPCANCIKSKILCVYTNNTQRTLESCGQSEYVYKNHTTNHNAFNNTQNIDAKWFKLTYVLERMVDFCHLDPKLSYIKSILDSGELDKAVGKKFKRNELNMITKVKLENYGVDPKIHNLIEFLVGMCFQFCILNPVTVQTIQKSYRKYGLNSYLVNCIAALMLPKYILIRGILKPLPLKDNIFYVKSLYLLSCPSTSKSEIALGAIYLFFFETNYGNAFAALIHLGMAKSACLELRLNMVDADNQTYRNNSQNVELCEKRNAWWCIIGVETIMSILYNIPISMQSNPEQCHIPHHLLNFNPGPYPIDENIDYNFQKTYSPSIYETLPHFKYMTILIWLTQVKVFFFSEMKAFYKSSKDINYRAKLLRDLDEKFEEIVIKNSKLFNLLDYEAKLKTEPFAYANASVLFIVIIFNVFIMLYYESIFMAHIDLKCFNLAEKYKLKKNAISKSLFNFIIKTMKLRNYPDPETDLTQYYTSSQVIPDLFMSIMTVLTSITTDEDRDQAQFILELLTELSLYFPKSQFCSDLSISQDNINERIDHINDINRISQKRILKTLDKTPNKQFYFQ